MKDLIPGGKSDKKPDSAFDSKQLQKGIKVEREHTKNKQLAKEIAKDHLSEFSDYYDRLEEMENKMSHNIYAKIAELESRIAKFTILHPTNDKEKYNILTSLISKHDGIWKNPRIVNFLKGDNDLDENANEDAPELHKAILRHRIPTDLGAVNTQISINPDSFKSKFRIKQDIFIYDANGIRLHFKVKNNYKDNKVESVDRDGKPYFRNQTDRTFNKLELIWERSPEIEDKIKNNQSGDVGWFNSNKEKIQLILDNVKENKYNELQLQDLRGKRKIDDSKLENLYDEAVAQSGQDFTGEKKNKTVVKIQSISVKKVESFGYSKGWDYKSQIIGVSSDFKQKILIKFGQGTRAGQQLAKIFNLPKIVENVEYLWIGGYQEHFTNLVLEASESQIKVDMNLKEAKPEHVEMLKNIKSGDLIDIAISHGMSSSDPYTVKVKRSGDILTFDNPIKHSEGDIHNHVDDLIGKKITVEGDFKRWQDLVFVSKPKFTKA